MNRPKAFVCEASSFQPGPKGNRRLGDGAIAVLSYVCRTCPNTHIMLIDTLSNVHTMITVSPKHAEEIGKALINPGPLINGNSILPEDTDRIDCVSAVLNNRPKPKKEDPRG